MPLDVFALLTLWIVAVPPSNFGVGLAAGLAARVALSAVYAVDFVIRIALAPRHWLYFRSHLRVLVVVLIPATRLIFSLRLLTSGFRRGNLPLFGAVAFALFLNFVTIVYFYERHASGAVIRTYGESLWWGMETVSTVGYGDFVPVTTGGRITAAALMVLAFTVLAVITAQIASRFIEQAQRDDAASERQAQPPAGDQQAGR
jgi:voltage-gated potassium channel